MIEVYMIRIWKTTLWWYGKCNPLRSRILKWDLYVITNLEMLFFRRLITDIEMDFITIIDMGFVFYHQYYYGICILSPILKWDLYFYHFRYLYALQIKKDLSTGALTCSDNTMALLASYIAQGKSQQA